MNRTQNNPTHESTGLSPAAAAALALGDEDNFLAAAMPGGIERQEKAGQLQQAQLQTLPKEGMEKYRPYLESLGFIIGDEFDNLFLKVTFPPGWKKQPTSHSMWSLLLDEKGRERAGIFYKAAFYDRRANFRMSARYKLDCYRESKTQGLSDICALDGDTVLKLFGTIKQSDFKAMNAIEAEGKAWLSQQFPGWDGDDAYKLFWD
jgi:hypothetical protein